MLVLWGALETECRTSASPYRMPEGSYLYCDVSLPVPLDQPFTYLLPETLRHRVKPGCRVLVPFGPRKLTGVVVAATTYARSRHA